VPGIILLLRGAKAFPENPENEFALQINEWITAANN
jgi:hypothetical protein